MTKARVHSTVKIRTYDLIDRAIEDGARAGVRRAHKHTSKPTEAQLIEAVHRAVLEQICEVIDFGGE